MKKYFLCVNVIFFNTESEKKFAFLIITITGNIFMKDACNTETVLLKICMGSK